ncbi:MAG: PQQ-binding-like beta-propeller repeat protein [Prosthecobacter sp.]|nr:PQQ-binding-like beta-propeller repeat protein [Prosthecobacter sp.]
MKTTDLVFVGFRSRVAALHRGTGEIVWEWEAAKGSSYLTLLVDRDLVIVSVDGYMYGLAAATGRELWFNPMKGFGTGVASLASASGSAQNTQAHAAAAEALAAQAATTHSPSS